MTICIIPARKNSKRIKNKNIINFMGKPMIAHVINLAKKSNLFSRIIVSTDCLKIAKIAKIFGAEVPFLRSKKLSGDHVNSIDVVIDAIKQISSENEKFHCCIYPTAVLTRNVDLLNGFKKIKKLSANQLIAVSDYDYSPYRSLKITGNNWIKFNNEKFAQTRSQDLPSLIHDTGSFYFYKTSAILKNKKNLPKKTTYLMIDRIRSVDINNPEDLKFAHFLYKFNKISK